MTNKQKLTSLALITILTIACNIPGIATPSSISMDDQAATIIAATLTDLARNTTDIPSAATESPVPQTLMPTATSESTPTITPTYSVPMLTLREQTNCRTGPSLSYDILFAYVKGVKREIVGSYPQENYWLIKSPESATGECWIWGEYADITGSYWVVPELTPPPTATMSLPVAPAVQWDYYCNYATGNMDIAFTWTDHAGNEDGYRILRNDQVIVELPPNSVEYKDSYVIDSGKNINYQIEVFNITGFTRSAVISVTC